MQVPTAPRVTVPDATEQTPGVSELKDTARPDELVAATVKAGLPSVLLESAPNVIVWVDGTGLIWNEVVACAAGK